MDIDLGRLFSQLVQWHIMIILYRLDANSYLWSRISSDKLNGKSRPLYLSHSLCSSESNPGSRPREKNIFLATRSNYFMATRSNRNCSTNEARNKCNTSFSWHFYWIHFWNYFVYSRSSWPCGLKYVFPKWSTTWVWLTRAYGVR